MPVIVLSSFGGEQPRIISRLLPATGAQSAINVRLSDGGLTPIRAMTKEGEAAEAGLGTIFRHAGTWLGWASGLVRAVEGPVDQERLYFTGDGVPKMRTSTGVVWPLAVPRPTATPTVAITGTATSADKVSRVYVYTYVTEFGEESEPSPPTEAVAWLPGQTVTISGVLSPPAGRSITKQRFYRTQTGRSGTYLYFIAERAASSAAFSDTVPPDDFQEPLPSASWNTPPDGLSGLVSMPNGMMAAFVGKSIYFCEPFRPHAWPEQYVLTVDAAIVALGAISNTLIVMTEAQPYIVTGSHPASMQMDKTEINLPCVNARGVADLGFAVVYPSHEGLVSIRADGGAGIVSGALFTRDEWLKLSPTTMIAAQIGGLYAGFYNVSSENGVVSEGALLIDISGQAASLARQRLSVSSAWYDVRTGGTYVLPRASTAIMRLDAPDAPRLSLSWKSKPFIHQEPMNYGALLIESETSLSSDDQAKYDDMLAAAAARNLAKMAARTVYGAIGFGPIGAIPLAGDALERLGRNSFSGQDGGARAEAMIVADGKIVTTAMTTNKIVRLPAGFKARTWEIAINSNIRIEKISLATTIADLQQSPPG